MTTYPSGTYVGRDGTPTCEVTSEQTISAWPQPIYRVIWRDKRGRIETATIDQRTMQIYVDSGLIRPKAETD